MKSLSHSLDQFEPIIRKTSVIILDKTSSLKQLDQSNMYDFSVKARQQVDKIKELENRKLVLEN